MGIMSTFFGLSSHTTSRKSLRLYVFSNSCFFSMADQFILLCVGDSSNMVLVLFNGAKRSHLSAFRSDPIVYWAMLQGGPCWTCPSFCFCSISNFNPFEFRIKLLKKGCAKSMMHTAIHSSPKFLGHPPTSINILAIGSDGRRWETLQARPSTFSLLWHW